MNLKPGGKQPRMHDTVWNGKVQRMVFPDGTAKGLKAVLIKRGNQCYQNEAGGNESTNRNSCLF